MIDIATAERCRIILDRASSIEVLEKRKADALNDHKHIENKIKAEIEAAEEKEKS
jgi:hypothetical protein